jgi:hypothetical protein
VLLTTARGKLTSAKRSALDNYKIQMAVASQGKDTLASQVAICFGVLNVIQGKCFKQLGLPP